MSVRPVSTSPAPTAARTSAAALQRWELDLALATVPVRDRARAVELRQAAALVVVASSVWAFDVLRLITG